MEDRKTNIIAILSVISLIIIIIAARVYLKYEKAFFLIAGAGATIILAVFTCLILRCQYNRRRKMLESRLSREGRELRVEYSFLRKVAGVPIKFGYKEIEQATDNFQSLIGRGASASVYKGILGDGTTVAVKRIDGQDRGEKQFRSEVAAIASVQHVNLVRLVGYSSVPSGPRFLVYEFISNGSLDHWIFPRKGRNSNRPGGCLSWDQRCRVAIDVAKALSYLHHDCRSRILHLDVKPENILLDENYRAIVSDFGLSKLMGRDESRIITTIRGTKGYLAPEWLLEHGVSEKCDVYSYGMVLLEIIGGRRNVRSRKDSESHKKWQYFPKIVYEKLSEGKVMEIFDPRLIEGGEKIDEKEVRRLAYVALWCIQERSRLRPGMDRVVEMLEGRVTVEEPPDTQMVVVDILSIDDDEPIDVWKRRNLAAMTMAAAGIESQPSSVNSVAMTTLSGR